jgi:hypothetical protein
MPNLVTFDFQQVAPPSPLYIQRDDVLVIQFLTAVLPETIVVNVRMLLAPYPVGGQPGPHAEIQGAPGTLATNTVEPTTFRFAATTAFVSTAGLIPLAEGYLLSVALAAVNATTRGVTFARAFIARGAAGALTNFMPLCADYISTFTVTGWPYGRVLSPTEGPGRSTSVNVASPAAGADWTMTVPVQDRRVVKSFSAMFTASAAAANRNISLQVTDGANVVWQTDVTVSVTANQVVTVNGTTTNVPTGVVATTLFVVIPPSLTMTGNWTLRTSTANIQGADQWSNIWLAVEDWIES